MHDTCLSRGFELALHARRGAATTVLILATVAVAGPAAAQNCLDVPLPAGCTSYSFEVTVDTITDPGDLLGGVVPGSTVSGTITIDTTGLDLVATPERGHYTNALECVRVELPDRDLAIVNTTVVVDDDPDDADPAIDLRNDIPAGVPPFQSFNDTIAMGMGGAGSIVFANPSEPIEFGGGGIALSYGNVCVAGIQSPCPPTLITDDQLPVPAPGDLTSLVARFFELNFDTPALFAANLFGSLDQLDASPPVPCPEPGFGLGLASACLALAMRARGALG